LSLSSKNVEFIKNSLWYNIVITYFSELQQEYLKRCRGIAVATLNKTKREKGEIKGNFFFSKLLHVMLAVFSPRLLEKFISE
jgi:hypothetical protein